MNQVATRPANPFGDAPIAARPSGGAVAQTDQQRAIAEVQAAMMIARANPRDPIAAMDRILNACTRPTLADNAIYQYSRGGSDISGPSIRLAEAIAQQWGNIKTSVRELEQSGGVSTVQTIAWDLETGYQCDKVFHVPHIRHTRSGAKRLEDPRDIYELIANQGARRLRACILAVIPGDVTEAAVAQCEATMKTRADTSPEAMRKMVEAFATYGVTREQIEKRIQRRIDAIQPAQVVSLKKVYASLRDGMSTPAEWFDPIEEADEAAPAAVKGAADKVKDAIRARGAVKKKAEPEPEPAAVDIDVEQGEQLDQATAPTDDAPRMTLAEVAEAMKAAQSVDAIDEAATLIETVADADQRAELSELYRGMRAALAE